MALSNFLLTVMGVGAVWLLIRSDLRQSSTVLSKNVRYLRNWLEKEAASASSAAEAGKVKAKEIEQHPPEQGVPKEDKQ